MWPRVLGVGPTTKVSKGLNSSKCIPNVTFYRIWVCTIVNFTSIYHVFTLNKGEFHGSHIFPRLFHYFSSICLKLSDFSSILCKFPRIFQYFVQNSLTFPWLENALPFSSRCENPEFEYCNLYIDNMCTFSNRMKNQEILKCKRMCDKKGVLYEGLLYFIFWCVRIYSKALRTCMYMKT